MLLCAFAVLVLFSWFCFLIVMFRPAFCHIDIDVYINSTFIFLFFLFFYFIVKWMLMLIMYSAANS